jgi:hypothetical protein
VYAVQLFARPRSAQIAWEIVNRASKAVIVEVDERSVTLRPRTTLRYRQCRATPVVVRSPAERAERTFVPERDAAYAIAEGGPGELRLDAAPRRPR